jgi:hypothetical protein
MKGIILKAALAILLVAAHSQANAQSEYREGYVIKQEGDTIWGFVNLAKKSVCHYKLQKSDRNHMAYQPGEIIGFGLSEGRYYESRVVKENPKSEKETTVFMECLVRGKASIYTYKGRYFIEKADTARYELTISKDEVISDEGSNKYFVNKQYIGILNYLFRDCPGINQDIQSAKLSPKDLTLLFTKYNQCTNEPYKQYQEHVPWMITRYSFYGGIITSSMKFTADGEKLFGSPFQSTSGIVGATAFFSWPRSIDRLSMSLGLMYFSTNFQIADIYEYRQGTAYSEGVIRTNELKLPWGLHYTFSKKKLAPMIGAGIAASYMLSNSTEFSWEYENDGEVETRYFDLFQPDKINTNYWVSAGATYKLKKNLEAMIELRYDAPANIAGDYGFQVNYTHVSVLVGIRFK